MRFILFPVLLIMVLFQVQGQPVNRLSVGLSYNQALLNYQRDFETVPLWVGVYLGVGNQDVNSAFDDVLTGIRLGSDIVNFKRSKVYLSLSAGMYFPKNSYYNAPVVDMGISGGYEFLFGEAKRHSLMLEAGYRYGRRDYIQIWEDNGFSISAKNKFILSPLFLSAGYGFYFN